MLSAKNMREQAGGGRGREGGGGVIIFTNVLPNFLHTQLFLVVATGNDMADIPDTLIGFFPSASL